MRAFSRDRAVMNRSIAQLEHFCGTSPPENSSRRRGRIAVVGVGGDRSRVEVIPAANYIVLPSSGARALLF